VRSIDPMHRLCGALVVLSLALAFGGGGYHQCYAGPASDHGFGGDSAAAWSAEATCTACALAHGPASPDPTETGPASPDTPAARLLDERVPCPDTAAHRCGAPRAPPASS
jgi:hypothetical protein